MAGLEGGKGGRREGKVGGEEEAGEGTDLDLRGNQRRTSASDARNPIRQQSALLVPNAT
jgi:hypothetical protein